MADSCVKVHGSDLRRRDDLERSHHSIMESFPSVHQLNALLRSFVDELANSWAAPQVEDDRRYTGSIAFVQGELLQLYPVPRAPASAAAAAAISASGTKDYKAD